MQKIKLIILDADGLMFHSASDTMENSILKFRDKFQNIIEKTGATHYIGFIGRGKTFRNSISKDYKANRKSAPPKFMMAVKEWARVEYGLIECIFHEADDAVAYWMNQDLCIDSDGRIETRKTFESAQSIMSEDSDEIIKYESIEKVMCAVDKDLLESIPGKHFNFSYKLTDKEDLDSLVKGWWVETTVTNTKAFTRGQMICGDAADGISGVPKKGEKYWEKMCLGGKINYTDILEEYFNHYGISQGIFEFQKTYRLLHILDCNEDFMREVGEVPTLPTPIKVEVEEAEFDNQIVEF